MNGFRLIANPDSTPLTPSGAIAMHHMFLIRRPEWFEQDVSGPRVVVHSSASPALWVYGHTRECDDKMIGATRNVSNQFGDPNGPNG